MAAFSGKGPLVSCSEEAEILACCRAVGVCVGMWFYGDGCER